MNDDRLPTKEQVWGLSINGEQLAYARTFFEKTPIHNTRLGGQDLVVSYNAEYDVVSFFKRAKGETHTTIDIYGYSNAEKLEKLPSYNGVFWMVWSHFLQTPKF